MGSSLPKTANGAHRREVGDMKKFKAKKLLGGYATGILSEEEKTVLYSAALENQEIFNALMDEDALKQILDNPKSRASVIAALELSPQAPSAKIHRFWTKPVWIGIAAATFLVFITTYSLKRSGAPLPPDASVKLEQSETTAAASPAQAVTSGALDNESQDDKKTVKNAVKDIAQTKPPPSKQENGSTKKTAEPAKSINQSIFSAGATATTTTTNAPLSVQEISARISATTLSPPVRQSDLIAVPNTSSEKVDTLTSRSKNTVGFATEAKIKSETNELKQPNSPPEEKTEASAIKHSNPIWTITRLDNERLSIKVVRTVVNAEIVLLLISDSGMNVIAPKRQSNNDFYFEVSVTKNDKLDLYQLNNKTRNYLKLLESGSINEQKIRIYPVIP